MGFRNLPEFSALLYTGIVDEHVDFAELPRSLRHKALAIREFGDIRLHGDGFSPVRAKALNNFFRAGLVREIADRNSGAFLHKPLRNAQSNALIASSDGYDLALQAIGHFISRSFTRYGKGLGVENKSLRNKRSGSRNL